MAIEVINQQTGTSRISLGIHPYNHPSTLPLFHIGYNPIPAQSPLWTPPDGLGFDEIEPKTVSAYMGKPWLNQNNSDSNYYHNSPSSNVYDPNWVNLPERAYSFSGTEEMTIEEYNSRYLYWQYHHNPGLSLIIPETFYIVSSAVNNSSVVGGWTPYDSGFAYATPGYTILTAEYFRNVPYGTAKKGINHPTYIDLLSGYSLDSRTIPSYPTITPSIKETITIGYYAENTLEPIPGLRSIYWVARTIELIENIPVTLPIKNCVLGTLNISSASVIDSILSLSTPNDQYSWNYLFVDSLSNLFADWWALYEADNQPPSNTLIFPESTILHKLAANNNAWDNADLSSNLDINFDINHPMFSLNGGRSYDWHVRPQNDTSIGNLVMDSIRTIEIHAALDAANLANTPPTLDFPNKVTSGSTIDANKLARSQPAQVQDKGDTVGNIVKLGAIGVILTGLLFLIRDILGMVAFVINIASLTSTVTNIAQTFLAIFDSIASLMGLGDDISKPISETFDGILNNVFGKEKVDYVKYNLARINTVFTAGANVLSKVRSTSAALAQGIETDVQNTSKIGNALRRAGVVDEKLTVMDEKIAVNIDKSQLKILNEKLAKVANVSSELSGIASDVKTAKDELKQLDVDKAEKEKAEKEKNSAVGKADETAMGKPVEIPTLNSGGI